MPMSKEEAFTGTARKIDRHTASHANKACFASLHERFELLPQQDCPFVPECVDQTPDIQHKPRS